MGVRALSILWWPMAAISRLEHAPVRESMTAWMRAMLAVAAFAASLAFGAPASPTHEGGIRAEPEVQPPVAEAPRAKKTRQRPAHATRIALDPPPADMALDRGQKPKPGTPLQIGFSRNVPGLDHDAAVASLDWEALPDGGQIAALSIQSPAAVALRVGLRVGAIPPGATL